MPSAVIDKIDYDPEYEVLTVVFQSGKVYYYKDVPRGVFLTLRSARSKGGYLNKYIKGNYKYESSDLL